MPQLAKNEIHHVDVAVELTGSEKELPGRCHTAFVDVHSIVFAYDWAESLTI